MQCAGASEWLVLFSKSVDTTLKLLICTSPKFLPSMCFAGVQIFTIPPDQLQVVGCWQRVQVSTSRKGQNIFLLVSSMEACKHLNPTVLE